MTGHKVAVVAGARTPFVKSGQAFSSLGPLELAKHAVRGLLERHRVDPAGIDAIAFGAVVPERGKPNLAREIVFEVGLPAAIEAQTVSSYCITGLRTATIIADAIAQGRISAGIAGGVEWLSGADPATFREPTTGLTMGEHMEITRKEWNVPRDRQDDIGLASHRNAVAASERLTAEIIAVEGVARDTGPRPDTSAERLAALKPAFEAGGTLTAGNSSPVTDGAAAVLLMSEKRALTEAASRLLSSKLWIMRPSTRARGCSWRPPSRCRDCSSGPAFGSWTSISSRSTKPLPRRCSQTPRRGSAVGRVPRSVRWTGVAST